MLVYFAKTGPVHIPTSVTDVLCKYAYDTEASNEGGRFINTILFLREEEVNRTRLIRGLIVALLFREARQVLHGSQGLGVPVFCALHSH